jgi:hypothetical protein
MAVAVTVTLVGADAPQSVQIAVTGLSGGEVVSVTAQAGTFTWAVRGGDVTAVTSQVVFVDAATPINTAITYTADVDGTPYEAAPVTVDYDGDAVLTSLDGRTAIGITLQANQLPRTVGVRSVGFDVPGRPDPVVRWDVATAETGELLVRTTVTGTSDLRAHLRGTGPVLMLRTDGDARDLDPVEILRLTAVASALVDEVTGSTMSTDRAWSLSYQVITDPAPATLLPTATWDDFDAAWAGVNGDDFDTEMAALDGNDFDLIDWTQYA